MKMFAILSLASALSAWADEPALKVSVLENNVLCVRASQLPGNFAEQLHADQPTNKTIGTILDLRFADGSNEISAGNLFSDRKFPLVILVNSQTRGSAANLATQLRAGGRGIVIGSTNAQITPDIAIAANSDAEKQFQENPFLQLPAGKAGSSASSNAFLPFIDHTSEADLVRKRVKDGDQDDETSARTEPDQPVIRDPALARAVDLLKALAILKRSHG
jgi:hypothetical protein